MELIAVFKQVNCPVLKYGLKKIAMDYYFCKNCDKEQKFPICHSCLLKCHKGHQGTERKKSSSENLIRCSCAMNNHQTLTEEAKYSLNSLNTCFFYELNKVTDSCFCYQNKNKKRICNFCYCFCKPNSPEEKEFSLEFTKIQIDNTNFKCKCPSFKHSKHTAVDIMSKNLSEINKSTEEYFPNTNSVILTNLYFSSNELFRSVNKKFISIFNQLILEHGDRYNNILVILKKNIEELYIKIPSIIINTYYIFRNNAHNCSKEIILYFVKDINIYFNERLFNFFMGNCLVGLKGALGNYKLEENFYENFLYGFKIFHIYANYFGASLPKYTIYEFICLNPYQRMMLQHNNKYFYHYDFEKILNIAKEMNKINQTYLSPKIMIQIFSIIKIFASIYIFSKEQINEFLRSLCFYFENLENYWDQIQEKNEMLKLFHLISKILIYFCYYYNDFCVMKNIYTVYLNNSSEKNKNDDSEANDQSSTNQFTNMFVYYDNEISRNISKCIIHITRSMQLEYNGYSRFNSRYKNYYFSTLDNIHILLRLTLLKDDFYDYGLRILIDNIDKDYISYLFFDKISNENYALLNYIHTEEQEINFKLKEYYTSSKSISSIINKFAKSLHTILALLGYNSSSLNGNQFRNHIKDKINFSHSANNLEKEILVNNKNSKDVLDKGNNKEEKNSKDKKKDINNSTKNMVLVANENFKLFTLGNYFGSLTNIFQITKDKNLFGEELCELVLFLFSKLIESSCDHFYVFVSKQIITNLINMPDIYQPKIISIIKRGIKKLIEKKYGIGYCLGIMNTLNNIYINDTLIKDELINYVCIQKILKIFLIISKTCGLKKEFMRFIKKNLMKNSIIKKTVEKYMKYLLKISEDFNKNKQYYLTHKTFNNKDIFKNYFNENLNCKYIYKIYLTCIEIFMDNLETESYYSNLISIKEDFTAKNIETILKIITLDYKLRSKLIQLFLILYINTIIDEKKSNIYRTQFQLNIDESLNESLLGIEQSRFFKFYNMLLNINTPSIIDEEYNILDNEIQNFNEIINYSNIKNEKELKEYYEYGILLPLNVYLNKVFSFISRYVGTDLLKIYSLTCSTLIMMKIYSNKMLIIKVRDEDKMDKFGNTIPADDSEDEKHQNHKLKARKKNSIRVKSILIRKIDEFLGILTLAHNSPLNYSRLYTILSEIILNYFEVEINTQINSNKIYDLSDNEGNKIIKNPDKEKAIFSNKLKDLYDMYINDKDNYDNLSYKSILELNYNSKENTFRKILVKYLLSLNVEEISVYDDECIDILLILLTNETENTQNSIMALLNKKEFQKLNIIIEKCFISILNSILSIYNPSYILINKNNINEYPLLNLFKLLCEGHNNFFQKIFLKQFYFSLNDIQKIGFYDLMLYILEKIIIISGWNLFKDSEEEEINVNFINLFETIIIMLIEIIQGTDDTNFYSLINQKFEGGQKRLINVNRMDPVLKKGKAFETFLKCVRNLITQDCSNLTQFNRIRKILMDFFLAFMEEYHCPIEIKLMIIINFHASQIIKSISKILKNMYLSKKNMKNANIYLNSEVEEYFHKLYFIDENLFDDPNFQLCCSFYNYFKITLLECQDTEALSFWNKINNIKEDNLMAYNLGTHNKTFKSDASDFEAYYVIKLFENISKSVLVKIKEDKSPMFVIYSKPPCLNYLSEQTKTNFLNTVNRSSRNTKLIELMEHSEYFRIEVEYNFHKLRNRELMKKLCWMNYYPFKIIIFIIDLILNFYMLFVIHSNGKIYTRDYHYNIIRSISLICCVIVFISFLTWFMTKMKLNSELEKVKYMEQNGIKDKSQMTKRDNLKLFFRAYFSKGELNSLFLFLIFRILGSINESFAFCYSFSLLALMTLSSTLSNLAQALVIKGKQLLWVSIFMFVVVYVYSGWGFYYLNDRFYDTVDREKPENMCHSLLYCFFTLINNGLRWYPGVGKVLRIDSPFLHLGQYIHNYLYHFSFYLIIRVVMLKIVFGIILDSFNELREIKANIEKDRRFKCFICNIEKDECEIKKNKDFNEHCEKEHNLWDYANYMIMLRMTDFQDLNGVNTKCKEMILERQIKWIPDSEM